MKKIFTIFGALILASLIFTSCSGKRDIDVKLKSTDVKGVLSGMFTVVDGSYKLITDGEKTLEKDIFKYIIKVQVKRIGGATYRSNIFGIEMDISFDTCQGVHLVCDLFDEQGIPVITSGKQGLNYQGMNSEEATLRSLKSGETGWAIFTFTGKKEIMNTVKTIEIGSKEFWIQPESNSVSSSNTSEKSATSSNVDCDQFIKDYEDFVNSYIKLLKKYKANPTDATILNEYTEAAKKAAEMQNNASTCTDAKYASKILELTNKLSQAVL